MLRSAFLLAGIFLSATPAVADEPGIDVSARYISMAIQGNLTGAEAMLERAEREGAPDALTLLTQFRVRFGANPLAEASVSANPLVNRVAQAYQHYWNQGLMRKTAASESEAELASTLSGLTSFQAPGVSPGSNELFERLTERLLHEGLYAFTGSSPPFRDLYLWRTQKTERYEVALTDRTQGLDVVFIDDIITQGWKEYASLGLASVTGWVEDGRLYCILWAYDIDSENFAVSYLKHEARHLADMADYPDMDTTELEYRAKLTELAFANQSLQRILRDFTSKAADNAASPHAMANFRVIHDLYERLSGEMEADSDSIAWVDFRARDINEASRQLLAENSAFHSKFAQVER
jgi:hypothetical protein